MAVIEGLQAAWGTISRIIAAFAAFMAFLLAVKGGSAGALFAAVLASAAVVVLDFVANWLLKKLMSAARKVGAKLKGMADKFKAKRKAKKDAIGLPRFRGHLPSLSRHDGGVHESQGNEAHSASVHARVQGRGSAPRA
jgi:voltage-gated potassium channel Kch